jgi:hypothetical protein
VSIDGLRWKFADVVKSSAIGLMDSALDFVGFVALAALLVVRGDIFEIKLGTVLWILSKLILTISILS